QRGRHEHALPVFLPAAHEARRAAAALVAEDLLAAFADRVEGAAAGGAAEHPGQPADRFADRHPVVVEDDQDVGFRIHAAGVVERLVGHARGHRAVTDHRHHLALVAGIRVGDGHAQRRRDRGRGVADAEGVVLAFLALGERRHAAALLDAADAVAAPGQDLVRVGLVADVPDDAVVGRVVEVVQDRGQFDHAQAGTEVAARLTHAFDQVRAQFVGDGTQLAGFELAQVGGGIDSGQERVARGIDRAAVEAFVADWGGVHSPILAPCYFFRRPKRPPDFPVSAGSGAWSGTSSAYPVARLALTKSTTSGSGTPLADATSSSVAGPFIIAVAMRKCFGYSRSVCGHLLSL